MDFEHQLESRDVVRPSPSQYYLLFYHQTFSPCEQFMRYRNRNIYIREKSNCGLEWLIQKKEEKKKKKETNWAKDLTNVIFMTEK